MAEKLFRKGPTTTPPCRFVRLPYLNVGNWTVEEALAEKALAEKAAKMKAAADQAGRFAKYAATYEAYQFLFCSLFVDVCIVYVMFQLRLD